MDSSSHNIKIGEQFAHWKVVEVTPKGGLICLCMLCKTTQKAIKRNQLIHNRSKSCGCQRNISSKKNQIKINDTFGHWQVKDLTGRKVLCECLGCKTSSRVDYVGLINGKSKSCGCMSAKLQKETSLERYGVEHPHQSTEIKERKKQTNLKNHGVEYPSQSEDVKAKAKATSQERYGLTPLKIKTKQTSLEKYGVEHPGKLITSKGELAVLTWIQTLYPNAKKYKTEGNEIAVFIPEINLGIEYNGLYWHSDAQKDKNYHLNKTKFFKGKGIRIIHIFEHEWRDNEEQVKSFIQSAIHKNTNKVGARKCSFIWTDIIADKKEVRDFLNTYHIQGQCNFAYAIKVICADELIGVATFGKHHRNSTDWVLSRFCTKTDYTIQGGLAKISKLAYQELQKPLISWAHYRISDGNGYLKAGWKYEELLKPDYFYQKQNKIISKQSRQKKAVNTPEGMTEREHAELDGLERIWDCGKIRFKYED